MFRAVVPIFCFVNAHRTETVSDVVYTGRQKLVRLAWEYTECYKTKVWTDFGRVRVRTEIGQ